MVEVDGAHGEGGGQVLRTSLALAALTGRAVRLTRIRAGRAKPGLAPQHLTTVHALARVCAADVAVARLGATELVFRPQASPQPGAYVFDVRDAARGGSAGAVTLLFQALLLPLAYAASPTTLTLRGGTHVPFSPPFDYLDQVFLPALAPTGVRAEVHLDAWGFYPVGNGQMRATVDPLPTPVHSDASLARLAPLTLTERGALRRVWGHAVACNLPADIAQRIANRARNVLSREGLKSEITPRREGGPGMGAALFLVAEYETAVAGFTALGAKGKPSEQVADEACHALLTHHATEAPVDPHLADQLLLPLALAGGPSVFRTSAATDHLLTNAHVIQRFLPVRIAVAGEVGDVATVTVDP